MSKKLIASLICAVGIIAVLLILFWTLFALKSVTVEFSSTTKNITVSEKEIVDAGNFRFGACVLFEGKKKSIQSIEEKAKTDENFAYLKVVNIETRFPNKFVIHITEREELFAVEHEGEVLICDHDFRVLKKMDNFESQPNNAILLNGLKFTGETNVGDFLQIEQIGMRKFLSVFLENNRNLSQILGRFESVTVGKNVDKFTNKEFDNITLTTFSGRKLVVNNIDFAFSQKVQKLFAAESELFAQDVDEETGNIIKSVGEDGSKNFVYVFEDEDGQLLSAQEGDDGAVPLTYALLNECVLVVDNLTLDENVKRTEKDIYYFLRKC